MNRLNYAGLASVAALTFLLSARGYDFHVSLSGNDNNPGTRAKPFATLDRARLAVRDLKNSKKGDILVGLHGGTYLLRSTIVFTLADSGSDTQKITYEAVGDGDVVFSSAVPLTGWEQVAANLETFPSEARGRVWAAPLPEGIELPKYLYQDGRVLPIAMSRGFIPTKKFSHYKWFGDDPKVDRITCSIDPGVISFWEELENMELVILPTCDWTLYRFPLESVNESRDIVKVAVSGIYGLGAQQKGSWDGIPSAWFANCRDGMLEPGNWYASTKDQKIYVFGDEHNPPQNITLPTLKEYLKVQGECDPQSEKDRMVENLHFKGFVFTQGKRHTWPQSHFMRNMQHEWEAYDEPNALVRLRGAANCSVTGCRFEYSGAAGIRLDLSAQNNLIEGNLFKRLGGSGIVLGGYGVGFKDENHGNQIVNNHIHHIGEAHWHSSAIIVFQSGRNLIANNLIHHVPYNGITLTGPRDMTQGDLEQGKTALISVTWSQNEDLDFRFRVLHSRDNVVEYNEFHHCVSVMGDGNPVYLSGAGNGNVVRYNYIHNNRSKHSGTPMRTDEYQYFTSFIGNVSFNNRGGIALKAWGHKASDNLFVDMGPSDWRSLIAFQGGPNQQTEILNNLMVREAGGAGAPFFVARQAPWLKPLTMDEIEFDNNKIYWAGTEVDTGFIQNLNDNHGILSGVEYKPMSFYTVEDGRLSLDPSADVFKQGHDVVDLSKTGLLKDFPAAWLDYDEAVPAADYLIRN
jgi:parallel beta-helix repeat protein